MKKLLPVLFAIACLISTAPAVAQVKLPAGTDRFHISNLRNYMLDDDGKSVSPHNGPVTDDRSTSFKLSDDEDYLLGELFANSGCANVWSTGEGRFHYNVKGGRHQDEGTCTNRGETDYRYSTNVTLSPGRIVLEGEAFSVGPCLPGETSCTRPTVTFTERAVLRVQGKSCTVESYQVRETRTSGNPYLKGRDKTVFVTFSTAKTRCVIE